MINPTIYLAFELARRGQESRDEAASERRAIATRAARPSRPRFAGLRRAFRRDWATADFGPTLRDYPYPTTGR